MVKDRALGGENRGMAIVVEQKILSSPSSHRDTKITNVYRTFNEKFPED